TGYDALISTVPLDSFIRIAGLTSMDTAAHELMYSSTHIVGVGLYGKPAPELAKKCWMYFPEKNCPFYRVTIFSNYSANNVPDINRYWSLMAEISESSQKEVDTGNLATDTIHGMIQTNLIQNVDQVHHTWTRTIQRGYPTPGLRRDQAL